jgi:hypothetical protein
MTPKPSDSPEKKIALGPAWQAALILSFGIATSAFVLFFGPDTHSIFDLLLLSTSLGALVTAGLWLWFIAAHLSRGWSWAFALTLWIPYANFVVASLFARRYWARGAREPALLALVAMVGQTLATLRLAAPSFTAPV